MISVNCVSCGESFLVSDETIGTQATCPACGKPVNVKAPVEEEESGPIAENAWEYSILTDHGRMGHVDAKKLNKLGRDGWELVAVFRDAPDSHTAFYFKRPLKG